MLISRCLRLHGRRVAARASEIGTIAAHSRALCKMEQANTGLFKGTPLPEYRTEHGSCRGSWEEVEPPACRACQLILGIRRPAGRDKVVGDDGLLYSVGPNGIDEAQAEASYCAIGC